MKKHFTRNFNEAFIISLLFLASCASATPAIASRPPANNSRLQVAGTQSSVINSQSSEPTILAEKKAVFDIHQLVLSGDIEGLKRAVREGAYLEKRQEHGRTPLHTAVAMSKFEAAEILIDAGVNLDARDKRGNTPLFFSYGKYKYSKLLISHGADIHAKGPGGTEPIHLLNDPEEIEFMVQQGADVNVASDNGDTVSHVLARNCHIKNARESLRMVLKHGGNLNQPNTRGHTPLFSGAKCYKKGDRLDMVQFLLNQGADPNVKDNNGRKASDIVSKDPKTRELLVRYERGNKPGGSKRAKKQQRRPPPLSNKQIQELKSQDEKVKQAMTNFFESCKNFWIKEGGDKNCSLEKVSGGPYGFRVHPNITLSGGGRPRSFHAMGNMKGGSRTFVMNNMGDIN